MTTIHIPPAALEAGCSAYTAVIYRGTGTQAEFREAIRAAFVAMVEAWEGMHTHEWQRPWLGGIPSRRSKMIKPEQVPDEVMNALLMSLRLRKGGKEALAAALNAWPGMVDHPETASSPRCLWLPIAQKQEDGDD